MKNNTNPKSKEALAKELVALRRLLEQECLRSEAYLMMIKLAEERYQVPIEKPGPKP